MVRGDLSSGTYAERVRGLDDVDAEIRFIAAVRAAIRADGGNLSTEVLDGLLDERNELTGPNAVRVRRTSRFSGFKPDY